MSKKSKGLPLPSADQYLWIGVAGWTRFERGSTRINLQSITNDRIATLLLADPKYWGDKFKKIIEKQPKDTAE